jgi:HlyD family secretion protein
VPNQKEEIEMQKAKKLLVLLLLAGIGFGNWFYFSTPESGELVLYGNVDQRQVELAFIDSERIAEILVQEGMEVLPGQVLARLETRRLRDKIAVIEAQVASAQAALERLNNGTRPEEIDQARAAVASAQAELVFAEAQYKRFSDLWKKSNGQAVSKQDVDEAQLQLNVARAKLLEQQKRLRLAEIGPRDEDIAEAGAVLKERQRSLAELHNQLDDAELKSPAHSVINRRLLEPGDMASPQRAAFSLAVLSPKWVRAYVAETDLGHIRSGMAALVFTDSYPDQGIAGAIGFISSVAEFTPKAVETTELRTSLVYEVRIYVEDSENVLRLGMPATVKFPEMTK